MRMDKRAADRPAPVIDDERREEREKSFVYDRDHVLDQVRRGVQDPHELQVLFR